MRIIYSVHSLITYIRVVDAEGHHKVVGDIYKERYGWSFNFAPELPIKNGWRPTYGKAKAVSARRIKKAMKP